MQKAIHILIYMLVLIFASDALLKGENSSNSLAQFPDLFSMDDYYECIKNRTNLFCTATLKLVPNSNDSKVLEKLKNWSNSRFHYNRTVIYRTLCIPEEYKDYIDQKRFVESKAVQELKAYNLGAKMYNIHCKGKDVFKINIYLLMFIFPLYLSLIVVATIYEARFDKCKNPEPLYKWLLCFSLISSWQKITRDRGSDFERLKSMQGIRTFQTLIIIGGHVIQVLVQKHIANTELIEQVFKHPIYQFTYLLFMLMMQTYFVMSTWLLTNHIFGLYEENGHFTIKHVILLILHRMARFWPSLLLMTFFGLPLIRNGPGTFEMVNMLDQACSKNGWVNLIFATNWLRAFDACNIGMWSLSLDIQYYFITTVALYLILKYKINLKFCLATAFLLTYLVNAMQIYQKDLGPDSWINLKLSTNMNFFYDEKLPYIYYGIWINSSSSIIGILFGYFYFYNKHNKQEESYQKLYGIIFLTLPIGAMLAASIHENLIVSTFIGPLLKPLFGLGIAVGIYGMSRNAIKGYPKSIFENQYAVKLGNFTFSLYIFHFIVVFGRGASSTIPFEIGLFSVASAIAEDTVLSWIVAVIATLIIEQPGISVKNLILPPVRKKKSDTLSPERTKVTKPLDKNKQF